MRTAIVFIVACSLLSCSRSPFKGYKPIDAEVHFRLNALGDGDRLPSDSDSALVRVRVARLGDAPGSLFSTQRWYAMRDSAHGFLRLVFGRMRTGDSASVIARASRVPWSALGAAHIKADTSWAAFEIAMLDLRTLSDARAIAAEHARLSRTAAMEDTLLVRYLKKSSTLWKEFMGVYYSLDPKNPKRDAVRSGEIVTIAYTANFLENGKRFDDTRGAERALTFRLGDPGQVIKGIEIALHVLPKGGKGRFIMPSALAFGPAGSSSGIVPPYTPVEYDVQVLEAASEPSL